MVFKYLTNIKRILDTKAVDDPLAEVPIIVASGRQMLMMTQVTQQIERTALKTFDAAGLLRAYRIRQWTELLPLLRPELALPNIPIMQALTEEEERYVKRIPLRVREEMLERFRRYVETEPERRMAEVEQLTRLFPPMLRTEQLVTALLENLLWTTRQNQVLQVLQQLLELTEKRMRYLIPIVGLESLQKLLLNYYVPYFMEMPQRHNMLGLMLTMMTMQVAVGKSASIYATVSGQGQQLKQDALLISDLRRVLRTKAVALTKKLGEWWQTVHAVAETADLKLTEKIPLFTDFTGKPMTTVTLFQALGHKYLISAWYARHIGFPENKWYLQYPRLEIIITRRGLRLHRKMRIPPEKITTFNRDAYLRDMRRWRSLHG